MSKKNKSDKDKIKNAKTDLARLEEVMFRAEYISKKDLIIQNFYRGAAFAAGSVLGATVLIALVLWLLSLFDTVPLVGPLFDNARDTIEQNR